jgi:hypothetical protein
MTPDERDELRRRVKDLFTVQGWTSIRVEPLARAMRVRDYLLTDALRGGKRFRLVRREQWIVDTAAKTVRVERHDDALDRPETRFGKREEAA